MTILKKIYEIITKAIDDSELVITEPYEYSSVLFGEEMAYNYLYLSDNIYCLSDLIRKGYSNKIDLIYIDPPFFTNMNFDKKIRLNSSTDEIIVKRHDFSDSYENGLEQYIYDITLRLKLMRELLSDTGSIYVHVDYRINHYIRIILDEIFGEKNFINEIIWVYKSGGASNRRFSRKHDNVYFYSKTNKYIFNQLKEKSYNRGYKPYKFKNVTEYKDDLGWYTLVKAKDVWDINMVGRTSRERVNYSTQKPLELIKKIILASTNENAIVADFYLGSGTTAVAASELNRKWIGCDQNPISIMYTERRLRNLDFKLLIEKDRRKFYQNFDIEYHKDEKNLYLFVKDYINIHNDKLKNDPFLFIEKIYVCNKQNYDFKILNSVDKTQIKENTINITVNGESNLYIIIVDLFGNIDFHKLN
jgi:site-specific DNA-methyltransferase (adenine-specific)